MHINALILTVPCLGVKILESAEKYKEKTTTSVVSPLKNQCFHFFVCPSSLSLCTYIYIFTKFTAYHMEVLQPRPFP